MRLFSKKSWLICIFSAFLVVSAAIAQTTNYKASFGDSLVDAANQGNKDAVASMVRAGKFVDTTGNFGVTALMRAAHEGHLDVVNYLLRAGANPDTPDMGGATALHLAARRGQGNVTTQLLSFGANVNIQDNDGWTPLMRASLSGQPDVVDILLQNSANPNLANKLGESPLQHAVYKNNEIITKMLLANGADVTSHDSSGISAADIAFRRGNQTIVSMLANAPEAQEPHYASLEPSQATLARPAPVEVAQVSAPTRAAEPAPNYAAAAKRLESQYQAQQYAEIEAPTEGWNVIRTANAAQQQQPSTRSLGKINSSQPTYQQPTPSYQAPTLAPEPIAPIADFSTPAPAIAAPAITETAPKPRPIASSRPRALLPEPSQGESLASAKPKVIALKPAQTPPAEAIRYQNDSEYLLQLATADTRSDAKRQWNRLRSQHADVLGSLQPVIKTVNLGSSQDQRSVYRVQAGYMSRSIMAESLCNALTDRQEDCFVVETSLKSPDDNAVETNPDWLYEAESMGVDYVLPDDKALQQPAPAATRTTAPADNYALDPALPWKQAPAAPAIAMATPPATLASPSPAPAYVAPQPTTPIPSSKPAAKAWIADYNPENQAQPIKPIKNSNYPTVTRAQAAATQPAPVQPIELETSQSAYQDINDFNDEPLKQYQAPASTMPALQEAQAPLQPAPTYTPPPQPKVVRVQPAPQRPQPVFRKAEPAPITYSDSGNVYSKPPTYVAPAPLAPNNIASNTMAVANNDIEVAEAVRVPLSNTQASAPKTPFHQQRAPIATRLILPSQDEGIRTEWVQLSYFESNASARHFWNDLSRKRPDLTSGLRFRLMSGFGNRSRAQKSRVRLGPVKTQAQMDNICDAARELNVRCTVVKDVGSSTRMSFERRRMSAEEASRFDRRRQAPKRPLSSSTPRPYWVQLGSYETLSYAKEGWQQFHTMYPDLLSQQPYHVTNPRFTSGSRPYRLRVGPYNIREKADNICNAMQARGTYCIILRAF